MITVQLWLTLLLCLWVYVMWSRRKYYILLRKMPGLLGLPLIGVSHLLMKREEILKVFYENEQKKGNLLLSWLGPFPFVLTCDPQIAQDILTSPHCVNKGIIYNALADGLGNGLLSSKNPEWSIHRRLLNPAFNHNILLSFIPIFNQEVDVLLSNMNSLIGQGETDLTMVLQEFTLNLTSLTTMGRKAVGRRDYQAQDNNLLESYKNVLDTMTHMCFTPWLQCRPIHWLLGNFVQYTKAKLKIREFIRMMIHEKLEEASPPIEDHQAINSEGPDNRKTSAKFFINIAIDLLKRGDFTWKNVEDESNIIVLGAFETTSNTIGYTLMMLAMFPQYQQRVFDELESLFPQREDFDVKFEDTQQMVYIDMVLNETMRLMAPVPVVVRDVSHEVKLSNGVVLPQGVQVAIDIFNMHRRVDIWGPESNVYNPENFLPSNMEGKHSYAFIPFTKGIRHCIGWRYARISTKIILAKLLRKFRFTTSFYFQDLQFLEDLTIKLKKTPLLEVLLREC